MFVNEGELGRAEKFGGKIRGLEIDDVEEIGRKRISPKKEKRIRENES